MEAMNSSMSVLSTILTTLEAYREPLDRIFVICLVCLIMVANVLMGCELDLNLVLSTLKRPVAPAIGFFTQFAIMPLLAFSIALLTLSSGGEHVLAPLGLFVTGCSPGGGASNYWTILLGGNTNLSITMTFISTIAAMAMMPLWIRLLGARLLLRAGGTSSMVHIPYGKMVASLVSLILPLFVGLLIARYRQQWGTKMRKLMRPFMIFVLIFIITFGITNNYWLLKMITWRILLAGMLLPLCGFMFGCLSAISLGQKVPDVIAIAVETGVQNTGIAIMVLKLTFPGANGDMASLLPIMVACGTPIPLLLSYAFCRLRRKFRSVGNSLEYEIQQNQQKRRCGKCMGPPSNTIPIMVKYNKLIPNNNNIDGLNGVKVTSRSIINSCSGNSQALI